MEPPLSENLDAYRSIRLLDGLDRLKEFSVWHDSANQWRFFASDKIIVGRFADLLNDIVGGDTTIDRAECLVAIAKSSGSLSYRDPRENQVAQRLVEQELLGVQVNLSDDDEKDRGRFLCVDQDVLDALAVDLDLL